LKQFEIISSAGGLFESLAPKTYDRKAAHRHICRIFIYLEKNQMKKFKRTGRNVDAKRGAKRNNRHAKSNGLAATIRTMAAEGLVEDEIALRLGLDKNELRARFIDAIKQGKSAIAASESQADELSLEEYHFCDVLVDSFNSHWQDPILGNLLFAGTDGKGGHTVQDMFAAWKNRGGRYNCTGRSTRFSKEKSIEFAKIVSQWKTEIGKSEP
jgi:hypothetical protein